MPTSLGPAEILVILVVALIVLGPKRLPEAGRQVGKAIAEVRRWSQGFQDEIRSTIDPKPSPPSYPVPMVPAGTAPPGEVDAAPPPLAGTNGSGDPPASHGHGLDPGSAPIVPMPDPAPTDPAPNDPSEPPAGEPPRT